MTKRELLKHELAWYKGIAKLRLLGGWSVKLRGKKLTVIVYKAIPLTDKYSTGDQYRLAVSYGQRILTSIILERVPK